MGTIFLELVRRVGRVLGALMWLGPFYTELFTGRDPARRSGQEVVKTSRVEPSWVRGCRQSHGSDRVGPGGFRISTGRGRVSLIRSVSQK